jgi:alpha-1,6-mannosyltransferase
MQPKNTIFTLLAGLVLLAGIYLVGYEIPRSSFFYLSLTYLLIGAAASYFWWTDQVKYGLLLAFLARLILVFAVPSLSDDCYRYIWDGHCTISGIHPFAHVPSALVGQGLPGLNADLLSRFNSPHYYSVYPTVLQAIFAGCAWLFPSNLYANIVSMKVFFLIFDGLAVYYILQVLRVKGIAARNVLLYALHPLVILELVGNLHAEGIMVCFLAATWYYLLQQKWSATAIFFSLSVATKLLPLLFFPLLFTYFKGADRYRFLAATAVASLLLFAPLLLPNIVANIASSLGLYYHQFEFNASLYMIFKQIQQYFWGITAPRVVGSLLVLPTITLVFYYFVKGYKGGLSEINRPTLMLFCMYLVCSAIVHPWYVILPLFLCIFTHYRFPAIWGLLVFFTYIHYSEQAQWEPVVITVEYLLVGVVFWKEYTSSISDAVRQAR